MAVEGNPPALAATTGRYQTVNTPVTTLGAGWERIAQADARRWFIHIAVVNKPVPVVAVMPGPVPNGFAPLNDLNLSVDRKYRDCPTVVQGEWYAFGGVGIQLLVSECLFLG